MRRDISFVPFEEFVDVRLDWVPLCHTCSVHRKQFDVGMVYAEALTNHSCSPDIFEVTVKDFSDVTCSLDEGQEHLIRQIEEIAWLMLFRNNNTEAGRIRKDGEKCKMTIILPDDVCWSFF